MKAVSRSGLQENNFHGQAPGLWPLKMDKHWFIYRQVR